jgi:dephospho-CoA kinase
MVIKVELTYREKELIKRGYSEELVKRLTDFDMMYAERISERLSDELSKGCTSTDKPNAIYIGGQPGSGKTTALREIKKDWENNNVICIIGLDNYRIYQPNYKLMEEEINKMWNGKLENNDESKGNDIADFTSNFAGIVSDLIIENLSNKKYNIAIEWGMRSPLVPLETMEKLKQKGYINKVKFIIVDKETSKEACKIRDDILNNSKIILRRIPNYFHDDAIKTLPSSAEQIYIEGMLNKKIIDDFTLVDRNNNILWDNTKNEKLIDTYTYYLNNKTNSYINDPEYSKLSFIEETKDYN